MTVAGPTPASANLGYSDGTIGELLGHAARGVTARHYIRRADPVLIAAADKVAERINDALDGRVGEVALLKQADSNSPMRS
jgi:hypothetical protein